MRRNRRAGKEAARPYRRYPLRTPRVMGILQRVSSSRATLTERGEELVRMILREMVCSIAAQALDAQRQAGQAPLQPIAEADIQRTVRRDTRLVALVPAWNTRALRRSARLKAKEQGANAMAAGFLASDEDSSEAGVDMESDSDSSTAEGAPDNRLAAAFLADEDDDASSSGAAAAAAGGSSSSTAPAEETAES